VYAIALKSLSWSTCHCFCCPVLKGGDFRSRPLGEVEFEFYRCSLWVGVGSDHGQGSWVALRVVGRKEYPCSLTSCTRSISCHPVGRPGRVGPGIVGDNDYETFHIPPLMSKRKIRTPNDGGWRRRRDLRLRHCNDFLPGENAERICIESYLHEA